MPCYTLLFNLITMITVKNITEKLEEVMDPELNMSIVDLGLVYKVTQKKGVVNILMTLTSLGCPLFDTIKDEIHYQLGLLDIKPENINIELTFDPPWSMDLMTERGKAMLGI